MKIIKCDDGVLAEIPNIFQLIYDIYGDKSIILFACLGENNKLSFVARDGINYTYISDHGYKLFSLDLEYNLKAYSGKEYSAYFDDYGNISFVDGDKNEYSIEFLPLDGLDDEDYNGEVLFNQYHPDTDTFCQLSYPHMYMEGEAKPKIYTYHTRVPRSVYIEEENSKDHDRRFGLVDKHIINYTRHTFERGMIGYNIMLLNEHGLINTLLNNSYVLERDDKLRRFTKSTFLFNGQYEDTWPFCTLYKQEDINALIEKYNFKLSVPEEMLVIHNDHDVTLREIREIIEQLKNAELREECEMKLELKR